MSAYFGFAPILPPSPNDPLVDVATQLDANYDEIERVLTVQQGLSAVVNPEIGMEVMDNLNGRMTVYNGSAFINSDDIDAGWSAFSALGLLAPIVARPNFTPRWRSNSLLRRVEVFGRVQNGAVPASFGTTLFDITSNTGGIPDSLKPVGGQVIYSNAGTAPVAPSTVSGSYIIAKTNPSAGQNVRIQGQYMGTSDGTSAIVLDGIAWWY